MNAPALRRGWCPGALTPMRSGDGLIVRLRITAGVLAPSIAAAIADAAEAFGNGLIDLSARGNFQLRGVEEGTLAPLLDRLAGLGLLDDDPAAESVRNVLASPLAGIDPRCRDVRGLAAALEERLAHDEALHALPAKFGFLIDGGGRLPLDGVEADIAFRCRANGSFAIEAGGREVGSVAEAGLVDEAARWALAFLAARHGQERRMRDVVGRILERTPPTLTLPAAPLGEGEGGARLAHPRVAGVLAIPETDRIAVAAAIPFGRLDAAQLRLLAGLGSELRLTPWRAILLSCADAAIAPHLAEAGFVVDPADPRLATAACPGGPACLSGEAPSQRDAPRFAEALAPLLAAGASLHVSGCRKGCARRLPASFTIVAEHGRYGLARDAASTAPFDTPLLTADEMERHLKTLTHA